MRVLHVYRTYFPDPPGGLQEAIRQIALATRPFGVETKVFTLSPTPEPREVEWDGVPVLRARSWAAPASCDLGGISAVRTFSAAADWADVIHYHFPWPFSDLLDLLVRPNKAKVMTYHSDIVRQKALSLAYRPLMKRTLASMDAVVATSPNYAATSKPLSCFVSQEQRKIIPLGIKDRSNSVAPPPEADRFLDSLGLCNEPFVLALGVLRYYKGLHILIGSAKAIKCKIVIAGSGPEGTALQRQAAALGLKNVIFCGQVSDTEKDALLRACYAFVLPSHLRSEAFGMVLVEASMFSRPLISCEIGSGMSYINSHGTTGLVVAPEDPTSLADAVNRLVLDPDLAARMGISARARYEALFSDAVLGQKYAELYRGLPFRRLTPP